MTPGARKWTGGCEVRYVDWLKDTRMLPAMMLGARIMRYRYESQWFWEETISLKGSTVAQRLLQSLNRARRVRYSRGTCICYNTDLAAEPPSPAAYFRRALLRRTRHPHGPSQIQRERDRTNGVQAIVDVKPSALDSTSRPSVYSSLARRFAVPGDWIRRKCFERSKANTMTTRSGDRT